MEGLGSSGSLVGSISTYPGTYKCPGSRVMAKNPGGDFFVTVHGIYIISGVLKRWSRSNVDLSVRGMNPGPSES